MTSAGFVFIGIVVGFIAGFIAGTIRERKGMNKNRGVIWQILTELRY